ncbi:tRNA-dihydrouridine synthase [Elysia marginata]|uniref:tRNA-dihydrouridine synthase n=1 Tax=Elysia marginata TaxID=1093978 RepID=A0AAV4FJV2_9GAST|nr:tRNA-dihydrouridine synthase [Elysia marginata]
MAALDFSNEILLPNETSKERFSYLTPMALFEEKEVVKICAPMVRYSKHAFRKLVRKYKCDLAFTPMIISDSFVKSIKARDTDFTTSYDDRPLIVQFAAKNSDEFANAAEIVTPYCDGVDLNCGCPQRWAMVEGYGACLISKPDLVADMVAQAKRRVNKEDFTVSIKIRIHNNIRDTVEMCRRAEKMGAHFITVHGRTKEQRTQPVDFLAIQTIKHAVSVPVVANGDIRSLDDTNRVHEETQVDGVMAARGILANPAMYAGYNDTPLECIKDWLDLSLSLGTSFNCFHHHLMFMMEHLLPRVERNVFNSLASTSAVLEFLSQNLGID